MDRMESVELLREKAGVSYEEAKKALEESGWDILDAIIMLERQGKLSGKENKQAEQMVEEEKVSEEKASVGKAFEEKASEERTFEEKASEEKEDDQNLAQEIRIIQEEKIQEEERQPEEFLEEEAQLEEIQPEEIREEVNQPEEIQEAESRQEESQQEKSEQKDMKQGKVNRFFRRAIRSLKHSSFQATRDGKVIVTIPALLFAILFILGFEVVVPVMLIALFFRVRYQFTGDCERANEFLDKASDVVDDVKEQFTQEEVSYQTQE